MLSICSRVGCQTRTHSKELYLIDAIRSLWKDNFENYIKGPEFHSALGDLFGNGIFNANGEEWKYQRKTASLVFNVKNFRDHFTEWVHYLGQEILVC